TDVAHEYVGQVIGGEGGPRLAQVLGVGAQYRHLTPVESCTHHQGVEPVALPLVTPGDAEDLLEELLQSLGWEIGFGELAEPEVVDPDPSQVPEVHLVGPFVDDIDAEVLEEGHDPRQGDLLTDPRSEGRRVGKGRGTGGCERRWT